MHMASASLHEACTSGDTLLVTNTQTLLFCCSRRTHSAAENRQTLFKKTFLQVVNAGPSSKLGVDNTTGCLPDVLQFCSPVATGQNTDLTCPSMAFRRPAAAAVPNGTSRVGSPLVHLYVEGFPLVFFMHLQLFSILLDHVLKVCYISYKHLRIGQEAFADCCHAHLPKITEHSIFTTSQTQQIL